MSTSRPQVQAPARLPGLPTTALRREPIRLLHLLWSDWRVGVAVSAGLAAIAGLIVALVMPRGPDSTTQALGLLFLGLAVGALAGLAMRSRWAMLLAPVANVAAFELGRRGTDGPLVDGIRIDSSYGILALEAIQKVTRHDTVDPWTHHFPR